MVRGVFKNSMGDFGLVRVQMPLYGLCPSPHPTVLEMFVGGGFIDNLFCTLLLLLVPNAEQNESASMLIVMLSRVTRRRGNPSSASPTAHA